jgi:hypothetical protein
MKVGAGYVWINEVGKHFLGAPFGGVKQSGLGREECLDELMRFTQEKNIHIGLGKAPRPCPRRAAVEQVVQPAGLPHVEQDVVVRRARHGDRRRGSSADIVSAFPWSRSWRSPATSRTSGSRVARWIASSNPSVLMCCVRSRSVDRSGVTPPTDTARVRPRATAAHTVASPPALVPNEIARPKRDGAHRSRNRAIDVGKSSPSPVTLQEEARVWSVSRTNS